MTTRRSLWAILVSALGVKASGQDKTCSPACPPVQTPQSTWSGLPHWFYGGTPVNRQCPVCGDMHDGKHWIVKNDEVELVECRRCRNAFFQDAGV